MLNSSLKQLGKLLANKEISSVELTNEFLKRIKGLNPIYNAFITVDEGKSAMVTAKAGGAQKVYWVIKRNGTTIVTGFTITSSGPSIDLTIDQIAVGDAITVEYDATVANTVTPGQTLVNTANLTYSDKKFIRFAARAIDYRRVRIYLEVGLPSGLTSGKRRIACGELRNA